MTVRASGPSRTKNAVLTVFVLVTGCSSEVSVQILPNDNAGALSDGGCSDRSSCPSQPGLHFQGPYDRVEIASSPLLDVPQDFAIEAWVFVESYEGGHGIFNRWLSTLGDIELTFGTPEVLSRLELPPQEPIPSHTLAAWVYIGTNLWITAYATMLPTLGAWHHLAFSYGGGALKLYVDGARWGAANGTARIPNPDSRVFIGATARREMPVAPALGDQFWPPVHGFIADIRMSNVDRYPGDFTPARHLLPDSSTIALWHLDEGSGTVATDSGPNHLNGVVTGAAWLGVVAR